VLVRVEARLPQHGIEMVAARIGVVQIGGEFDVAVHGIYRTHRMSKQVVDE
jgi:hypothetical protein